MLNLQRVMNGVTDKIRTLLAITDMQNDVAMGMARRLNKMNARLNFII